MGSAGPSDLLRTGGYEFHEIPALNALPDDPYSETIWVEKKPQDDYLKFPNEDSYESGQPFGEMAEFAGTGIARHTILKSGLLKLNEIELGYPESKSGYSARQLNLLGDDKWFGECWQVLYAHGWMHRSGVFNVGQIGGWQWTQNGEKVASIGYIMEAHGIRLKYTCDSIWNGKEDIDYVVPILRRPCRFGGTRPYFRCPGVVNGRHCARTVAKLYGGRYFLCRHCHNLAYYSQSEEPHDRLLRKANKKRMALGGEPGTQSWLPERPKGMWHRTYEREIETILGAEKLADTHFMVWMMRKFGTSDVYSVL